LKPLKTTKSTLLAKLERRQLARRPRQEKKEVTLRPALRCAYWFFSDPPCASYAVHSHLFRVFTHDAHREETTMRKRSNTTRKRRKSSTTKSTTRKMRKRKEVMTMMPAVRLNPRLVLSWLSYTTKAYVIPGRLGYPRTELASLPAGPHRFRSL
jgi:hypothetical protein